MKMLCIWRQREFARFLEGSASPGGTPLARHLARCGKCRAEWEQLRRLSSLLPEAVTAPTASGALVSAMWTRIEEAEKRERTQTWNWRYALPAVVLALFALAVGVALPPKQAASPAVTASQAQPAKAALASSPLPEKALPARNASAQAGAGGADVSWQAASSDAPPTRAISETIRERGKRSTISWRAQSRHGVSNRAMSQGAKLLTAAAPWLPRPAYVKFVSPAVHSDTDMVRAADYGEYNDGSQSGATGAQADTQSDGPNAAFTAGHDGGCARFFGDDGLLRVDYVHDDAALEHFRQAYFGAPS